MPHLIREGALEEALEVLANIPEFDELRSSSYYQERLFENKHLILITKANDQLIGCKIGYDRYGDGSFYSWLGGVLPAHRKDGIAKALAKHQQQWAKENGYVSIRFKTMNRHKSMLIFAIKDGFEIFNVKVKPELKNYRIELIKHL